MELALLAQAAPVLGQDTAFVLPVVLLLLGAAAAIGESRWRVASTEKRVEMLEARQSATESRQAAVEGQLGTAMAILGRVEKGVEDIQQEVRAALRKVP